MMKSISHALSWRYRHYIRQSSDLVDRIRVQMGCTVLLPRKRRIDKAAIAKIRGICKGERCFLVGTAPSLVHLDLSKLSDEKVFSVNRGYDLSRFGVDRLFGYVISDPAIIGDYSDEIDVSGVPHVFVSSAVPESPIRGAERAIAFDVVKLPRMTDGFFQHDLTKGLYDAHTVMIHAVQIAAWMGFSEIYVVGVDLSFDPKNLHCYESTERESRDAVRRSMVHAGKMAEGFRIAGQALAQRGVRLANAGVGGHLDTIERVSFGSLFS